MKAFLREYMRKPLIDQVERLIRSENWQDRKKSLHLIKENTFKIRDESELAYLWGLLKQCLKDTEGRVRNQAFYTFGSFRGGVLHDAEHLYISIMRELYAYAKDLASESEKAKFEKAFQVYAADFVTTENGTGIVHTAVMYGQEDFELGNKIGLP